MVCTRQTGSERSDTESAGTLTQLPVVHSYGLLVTVCCDLFNLYTVCTDMLNYALLVAVDFQPSLHAHVNIWSGCAQFVYRVGGRCVLNHSIMHLPEMQAALAQAQKTVQALLQGLHSNPQTKADAAKGIIRGPQLAVVELQLRKLKVAQGRDSCQGLADAIVSYYQQLGHMLSCAADLRYG